MIETRRLKNVVIFIQTILSFVLSRNIEKKALKSGTWSILDSMITGTNMHIFCLYFPPLLFELHCLSLQSYKK